jgi:hypothetical protein
VAVKTVKNSKLKTRLIVPSILRITHKTISSHRKLKPIQNYNESKKKSLIDQTNQKSPTIANAV